MKKNKTHYHLLNPNQFPGRVRVIGGQLRGRFIDLPKQHKIRPTTNINRETLFNWIGERIKFANCLDIFAGSGALGIEALSRGAEHVTFIDSDIQVLKNITIHLLKFFKNSDIKNFAKCIHLHLPNIPYPALPQKTYDIIFIDPPFYQNLAPQTLGWLEQQQFLKENSLIFVEVEAKTPLTKLNKCWHIEKEKLRSSVYAYLLSYHLK